MKGAYGATGNVGATGVTGATGVYTGPSDIPDAFTMYYMLVQVMSEMEKLGFDKVMNQDMLTSIRAHMSEYGYQRRGP